MKTMISKERIALILLRIAVLLLLGWLCVIATSCGSKKKLIQKSQFTTDIATVERVKESGKTEAKTDISTIKVKQENNVSIQENFQGEIEDPNKEATLTVENLEGKKVYRYINFKNVSSGSQFTESKSKDSLGQNLSKIAKSETTKESELEAKAKTSGSERSSNVEKTGLQIPFYWWIIFVLIILGYLAFSYFKKTLNPRKWI